MFFNKNKEKVSGLITQFIERDNKHYPVLSFVTKDGVKIEREEPNGPPLEELLTNEGVKEFLEKALPINDVDIIYKKDNPYDFYGKYI